MAQHGLHGVFCRTITYSLRSSTSSKGIRRGVLVRFEELRDASDVSESVTLAIGASVPKHAKGQNIFRMLESATS